MCLHVGCSVTYSVCEQYLRCRYFQLCYCYCCHQPTIIRFDKETRQTKLNDTLKDDLYELWYTAILCLAHSTTSEIKEPSSNFVTHSTMMCLLYYNIICYTLSLSTVQLKVLDKWAKNIGKCSVGKCLFIYCDWI